MTALRMADFRQKMALGHYELTGHAKEEMEQDGFTVRDIKAAVYSGRITGRQRHGPGRRKYVVRGAAEDRRSMCVVCCLAASGRLRVITVFED